MAQESSQPSVRPEGRLATISRWATAFPVIPLLTGLTFAASTVFACVAAGAGDWLLSMLGFAIPLLIVGIGLGFLLRRAMMRIRDSGRPGPRIWVVVGVGLVWILAFFGQFVIFAFLHGFSL
jgi:uncharacterized RDD family membrane protein YckC